MYYYSFTQEGSSGTKIKMERLLLDHHIVVVVVMIMIMGL